MDFYPVLIDRVSIRFTNRRRVDLHMSGAQSESRFISAWSRNPCADARTERVADELQEKGIKGEKWIRQASGYRRESIWFRPFTEIIATTKKENIFFRSTEPSNIRHKPRIRREQYSTSQCPYDFKSYWIPFDNPHMTERKSEPGEFSIFPSKMIGDPCSLEEFRLVFYLTLFHGRE